MKFDPSDKDKQFIITGTEIKHTYVINPDYTPKDDKKKDSWFHWSLIPVIIVVLVLAKGS